MASTNDLMRHDRLAFVAHEDGSTHAVFDMQGWGNDVVCRYWKLENPGRSDPWRYELEMINGRGGTYPHLSEHGCKIAIVKHLVEAGLIEIPEDNGHLDARNLAEVAAMEIARERQTGRPRVGDFVIMPDGHVERCCNETKTGMQTATAGSFNVMRGGSVSFSGGLNRPRLWEYFRLSKEKKRGQFWFFSHGISGPGRGVECYMPCRVYVLEPFTMTEAKAREHEAARRMAATWGEGHAYHQEVLGKLMAGEA